MYMKKLGVLGVIYVFYVARMVCMYHAECWGVDNTKLRLG
jgi:hypothetical protein